jgi:hypothetical protein
MNSLGLSGISVSSGNDMGRDLVSYKLHTMVLWWVMGLEFLLPYTVQMLDIRSCGVLPSCMWYTKRLFVYPYSYSGRAEMLIFLDPPSVIPSLGSSVDTSFLPIARMPVEPLPASRTSVVAMDILSVGVVN